MLGTDFAILSNRKDRNLDLAPLLPPCHLMSVFRSLCRSMVGIPIMSPVPWEGKEGGRERRCHHPVPQQIMDTQSRLLHWEPEARLTEGAVASLCPYITAVDRTSIVRLRQLWWTVRQLWDKALCWRPEWCAQWSGVSWQSSHSTMMSFHDSLGLCRRETKSDSMRLSLRAAVIQTRINNIRWCMMSEVKTDGPKEVCIYVIHPLFSSLFTVFHPPQVLFLYVTVH